jgi:poly(A) polymerase
MKYDIYEVGGKIRDEILGLRSNDVDYSVVIRQDYDSMEAAYDDFIKQIESEGFDVKKEHPDTLTVRALFPKDHIHSGVADFVIARREVDYPIGSRTPICELGTLLNDLERRDFTVNAIAKDINGKLIDPFGGINHLGQMILDTPGEPVKSFTDDPLRIIRAMRFCITKGFTLSDRVRFAICELGIQGLEEKVHSDRIAIEINKCLRHNSYKTLKYFHYFTSTLDFPLMEMVFSNTDLWLTISNKKRCIKI